MLGQVGRLSIEQLDIFCQDIIGISYTFITNIGQVGRSVIEYVDILDKKYI